MTVPMPVIPYQEEPDDEFEYETDWKECMELSQPGGGGHASATEQEEVLVGLIDFNKLRSAERYFLGYSYANNTSGSSGGSGSSGSSGDFALHREPPAVHPRKPNLRAFSFSAQGFVPVTNPNNTNGRPYEEAPFVGAFGESLYYGKYQKSVCTIRYKSWGRVRFLPDSQITTYQDEWKRWTNTSTEPQLDILQTNGVANMKYADGPGAGKVFEVPLPTYMSKMKLVIDWLNVPFDYLSDDPDLLNPRQFLKCMGRVNDDLFLGKYQPGTVAMLEAPTFVPTLYPVQSDSPDEFPFTGYDVRIVLSIFEPPTEFLLDENQGHNLLPWFNTSSGSSGADTFWYYGTRNGQLDGQPLLPYVPFNDMFKNANQD